MGRSTAHLNASVRKDWTCDVQGLIPSVTPMRGFKGCSRCGWIGVECTCWLPPRALGCRSRGRADTTLEFFVLFCEVHYLLLEIPSLGQEPTFVISERPNLIGKALELLLKLLDLVFWSKLEAAKLRCEQEQTVALPKLSLSDSILLLAFLDQCQLLFDLLYYAITDIFLPFLLRFRQPVWSDIIRHLRVWL